jgi:hypothetical protein
MMATDGSAAHRAMSQSRQRFLRQHGLSRRSVTEQDFLIELYDDPNERATLSREQQAGWAASRRAGRIMTRAGGLREGDVALMVTSSTAKMLRATRSLHGPEDISQEGESSSPTPAAQLTLNTCSQAREEQRMRDQAPPLPWSQKCKAHVIARFRGSQREPSQVDAGVSAVVFAARLRSRSRVLRPHEAPAAAGGADSGSDKLTGQIPDLERNMTAQRPTSRALHGPSRGNRGALLHRATASVRRPNSGRFGPPCAPTRWVSFLAQCRTICRRPEEKG